MKKVFFHSLIITLIIQISGIFSFTSFVYESFDYEEAVAQSPALPIYSIYRDAAWWETITTTAQSLSWDTEVSENSEIPLDGSNTRFDLTVWWHYLVMYSVPVRSTWGWNRSEAQSWLRLNNTTNLEYWYASSYIRRADNDFEWYHEWSAIIDATPWDTLEVQIQKTDSNSATFQRTPARSWINILKLDDAWEYVRLRPAVSQAVTTSWTEIDLWVSDELDSSWFSLSWNDVTLSQAGKYLVTYNVWTQTTWTDRTNNEMRLTLSGSEIEATRSTAYIRAQNGSFTWISSFVWIIETSSANQILQLQMRRESTLQGTTNVTVPSKTGISIVKLPDGADYVRVWESWGGQDMTNATNTPVTFDTTLEQWTAFTHDSTNTEEIDISEAGDYLFLKSIYNARSNTSNGPRENPYLEWQVNGTTIQYWNGWSYNRASNDGDGIMNSSHSSAWVILPWLSGGDVVELTETNEATNGASVYTAERMGVQWIKLDTLFTGAAYLTQPSYRWRDDSSDFESGSWWLASENISISNIEKWQKLRLRMKVQNPSSFVYDTDSQFELQWAQTASTCSNGLSWSSIDSAWSAFTMFDSSFISPNGETSTVSLLTNPSSLSHILSEWYHAPEAETFVTLANTFTASSQKEYEFSFEPSTAALWNTVYCFRLYDIEASSPLSINNYARLEMGSTWVILDDIWWEAWSISSPINGWWTTVNFTGWPYTSPVIVGRSNTHDDPDEALVFEARNVSSTWAEVRLCNSNAWNSTWCRNHWVETIWYIVVDSSQTSSINWIESGTFTADQSFDTTAWTITTNYSETFTSIPYVFTSIQTTNWDSPIVTRVKATSLWSFDAGICQQNSQDGCNNSHPNETVGWIAVDPSINPFLKDMDIGTWVSRSPSNLWSTANFTTSFDANPIGISQTVTNLWGQDAQIDEIQSISTTWMEFRSCEIDNDNLCDTHAIDTIRWLAIEEWVFATEYFLDETHYRWYENNNLITPTVSLASENTQLTNIPANNQLRLRLLVQNSDPDLPGWVLSLKLQYWSWSMCESITIWTDVWNIGWSEDWIHHDIIWLSDGDALTSSILWGWWHSLQTYNESTPTTNNLNPIALGEKGEWDFSLLDNTWVSSKQYCFRVVTQDGDEIEYTQYAKIDTTDTISPTIDSFNPASGALLPIWNFEINYTFSDWESGINVSSATASLQKWNGTTWDSDISWTYLSLDTITTAWASYNVTNLPYGRYRSAFAITDNAGNSDIITHEFYVDEIEFTISDPEIDVGNISTWAIVNTSSWTLTVTVRTVWAAFDVFMTQQTDMTYSWEIISDWDGSQWFWYEEDPFWTINAFWTGNIIWSEVRNLNPDGEKNTYSYDLKYSVLLDILTNYWAGDYESLIDFQIQLEYN